MNRAAWWATVHGVKESDMMSMTIRDPMDCSLPGSSLWDFPGKSTGVGCYCLLRHTLKGLLKKKEDYYDHVYFILFFFMTMFKLNFFILLLHCFHYDFESQREWVSGSPNLKECSKKKRNTYPNILPSILLSVVHCQQMYCSAGLPSGRESPQPSPWLQRPPQRHGPAKSGRRVGSASFSPLCSAGCLRPVTHLAEVRADPAGGQLHVEGCQVLFACAWGME